jgi:hypothetical protein
MTEASDLNRAAYDRWSVVYQRLDIAGDEDLATLNADWRRHIGRTMIRIWVFERTVATV